MVIIEEREKMVHNDIVDMAVKSAAPVTVSGCTLAGIGLPDWVLLVTIFWILLQAGILIRDKIMRDNYHRRQNDKVPKENPDGENDTDK